jgi:hypothetical protein
MAGDRWMKRFVEGEDRGQMALLPDCPDDYVAPDNPVCVTDAFGDELDLASLGFAGVVLEATGRGSYHALSHRLQQGRQHNTELMWLTGHLKPDSTIQDARICSNSSNSARNRQAGTYETA